jgi:hypothetical protein
MKLFTRVGNRSVQPLELPYNIRTRNPRNEKQLLGVSVWWYRRGYRALAAGAEAVRAPAAPPAAPPPAPERRRVLPHFLSPPAAASCPPCGTPRCATPPSGSPWRYIANLTLERVFSTCRFSSKSKKFQDEELKL